ncbi:MAG: ABC transporter permease [Chromatiaceae bacterium]|nr:ABC transporter permease [Chromatiaceae bacterium]
MKFLGLLLSGLRRKKTRTILTLLSITVAFVLFGYLAAIKQGFDMGVSVAGADRLITRHRVSLVRLLPESYEARIERIQGVVNAVHSTWFGGVYQKPTNFFAQIAVPPEEFLDVYPEYLLDDEEKAAWLETRTGAIAGRVLADRYGWKVGDRIPLEATIWTKKDGGQTWDFDLVGIYEGAEKGTDTSQFFFRYDYFDEARLMGAGMVGWYTLRIDDPENAARVAAEIDEEFANSPSETKTEPEGAFLQGFANQLGNIGIMLKAILSAVFFTILLVTGNTIAQSVRERTQEIAVLKALGFTHIGVLFLVLAEAMLIVGVGGFSGLALAWLLTTYGDPTNGALPVFFIPLADLAIGILIVLLMGLAAGILPAIQAQRLRIADALRR